MRAIELENLAVEFRCNYPNLCHTDTLQKICQIGGIIAVKYGYWMAERYRRPRSSSHLRYELADLLDAEAKKRR